MPGFSLRDLYTSLWRMLLAGVIMAEAVWGAARAVGSNSGGGVILRLAAGTSVGILVYVLILLALEAPEIELLAKRLQPLKNKLRPRSTPDSAV